MQKEEREETASSLASLPQETSLYLVRQDLMPCLSFGDDLDLSCGEEEQKNELYYTTSCRTNTFCCLYEFSVNGVLLLLVFLCFFYILNIIITIYLCVSDVLSCLYVSAELMLNFVQNKYPVLNRFKKKFGFLSSLF